MEIKTFGVIGAGIMGGGIAQVAAASGYNVILNDIEDRFLDKGISTISNSLERMVKKEKLSSGEKEGILARISRTLRMEDMSKADFVIEAAIENESLKLDIFKRLDKICPDEVILASNTSSISITKIASITKRPDKVIGMHFFNPVAMMKLVEIIKGLASSDDTYQKISELAKSLGKTPAQANDFPGFIANRIWVPMINEAVFALHEGVGTVESIDTAMKLAFNHPMGPLELCDLVGLDTILSILEVLYQGFGDPKYRPCSLLKKYVDAGYLGRKSGKGFYSYEK